MNQRAEPFLLKRAYQDACNQKGWQPDKYQESVIHGLQALFERLHATRRLLRWCRRGGTQGVYLWGSVGRGKTALMDLFYQTATVSKKRFHFHAFMNTFHQARHNLPLSAPNPVEQALVQILGDIQLLCLDEFQVSNIADAMVLKNIFHVLAQHNISFILTSNTPPDDLYAHGLNRERFLPFIDWLHRHTQILSLDGSTDYRVLAGTSCEAQAFFHPHTPAIEDIFAQLFQMIAGVACDHSIHQQLLSSQMLTCLGFGKDVTYTTFEALCDRPLGISDYLILAQTSSILIVQNIPLFTLDTLSSLHRWITLIDIWYDHHHVLIASGAQSLNHMVPTAIAPAAWSRTQSRLEHLRTTACVYLKTLGVKI